jgi:hypothetical protein
LNKRRKVMKRKKKNKMRQMRKINLIMRMKKTNKKRRAMKQMGVKVNQLLRVVEEKQVMKMMNKNLK